MNVSVADYRDPLDAADVVLLTDAYARDPMGGGEALSADVCSRLADALAETPGAFSLIARMDGRPVGIANCALRRDRGRGAQARGVQGHARGAFGQRTGQIALRFARIRPVRP